VTAGYKKQTKNNGKTDIQVHGACLNVRFLPMDNTSILSEPANH